MLEANEDLIEVTLRGGDGKTAQPVVASEFDNHYGGLERGYGGDARQRVGSRFAADSGIDHAIAVMAAVELLLQEVRIAFARVSTEAGGQAVSEGDDNGPVVGRGRWRRWLGLGTLCRLGRRTRGVAAADPQ